MFYFSFKRFQQTSFMQLIFILLLAVLTVSCGDDTEGASETLIECTPESLSFSNVASSQELFVESTTSWAVSSSAEWCTISQGNGYQGKTTLLITCASNEGFAERSATITFSSVTYKKEVMLTQAFEVKEVAFSDDAFKSYCRNNLDGNGDGIFSLGEASKIEVLDISSLNISTLDGIESFTALSELNCSNNNIESINTDVLPKLTHLNCANNKLSEITIRNNIDINYLDCSANAELTDIYVWTGFVADENFTKPQGASYIEPEIDTPVGYKLVWQDEFNDARSDNGNNAVPNTTEWWYETGDNGWGNNEIQNYIAGVRGQDTCAAVYDGSLKIMAKQVGSEVLSIRMNTKDSWTYGYFEARLKLPVGKGTWPAFWMMPQNFTAWPADGEIDIMEEVGANPGHVSSTIHCTAYNHQLGTQKSGEKYISTAESEFHIYAVEWTEDYIKAYIDGELYFTFNNDKAGNKDTWPFDEAFYLKLNLAWGGDWGGYMGIDESALPCSYEVDYVRVFQKQ